VELLGALTLKHFIRGKPLDSEGPREKYESE
jgi:hypothetical protein